MNVFKISLKEFWQILLSSITGFIFSLIALWPLYVSAALKNNNWNYGLIATIPLAILGFILIFWITYKQILKECMNYKKELMK